MATVNTDTNGRVRKSLAEQIDRLDGILDGLADGLNEAVVTAVKEAVGAAVQEAVRAVLSELLANPDLLHSIRDSVAPPATAEVRAAQPTDGKPAGAAISTSLGRCWAWLRAGVASAKRCLGACLGRGRRQLGAACSGLCVGGRFVRHLWRPLLIALGVGSVLGVAAYVSGPWLCTAAGGLAGFTTSLAVQARRAVRQLIPRTQGPQR
jgi:hypothetical protein